MILKARVVLPVSGPVLENGAVRISGNRITAVGPGPELKPSRAEKEIDLGDAILMPGLVNAHCHLDYTQMAGQFPSPRNFIDWLKVITSTKSDWTATDYTNSWLEGARMLVRTGTTTVADIEAVPQLLPEVWNATPLRILSLLEMIGITGRRSPEVILQEAVDKMASLKHSRCWTGLSPHAPYSTVTELLRRTVKVARQKGCLVCTHVAESQPEFAMFAQASGDMFDWLQRSGREMSDCGLGSPVQHLERCGMLFPHVLLTHANYLARGDAKRIAVHDVSVVHCPRSHAYFRHDPFPLRRLLRAGVNVCLGTDSLASVIKARRQEVELDMFAEMRLLAERQPWLRPEAILRMATVNAARALRYTGRVGELSSGTRADLIVVPVRTRPNRAVHALLEYRGNIAASMIDGKWALAPI